MADSKLHPAQTVTNIKNLIPITLDMEKSQYSSRSELFKIHCRAYKVLDHIIPVKDSPTTAPAETWSCIDAIVLQWIYVAISNDLLQMILQPNTSAKQAWDRLANISQDNKTSRAIYLERQFANTHLDSCPNISVYCQELKVLADQLAYVDSPVSNTRLVLQLLSGLTESYDGVATLI